MNELSPREQLLAGIPIAFRAIMDARSRLTHEPWLGVDLTMKQLKVLFVLTSLGPSRPNVIASAVGVSAASATGLLDRLVEQGYIERQRDPADRRAQLIALTEVGRQSVTSLQRAGERHLRESLEGMSDDDLASLGRGLAALGAATRARAALLPASPEESPPAS